MSIERVPLEPVTLTVTLPDPRQVPPGLIESIRSQAEAAGGTLTVTGLCATFASEVKPLDVPPFDTP
jgi:hypothetical protein